MKLIHLLLTAAVSLLWTPGAADACSCARISADHYYKAADMVFFARAGKEMTVGTSNVQELTVLYTLKGQPGKVFRLTRRAGMGGGCDRYFKAGELSLVLANKGKVGYCGGNLALDVQLRDMARYFSLSQIKTGKPGLAAFEVAFAATLKPYLHGRPRVSVRHAALKGKQVKLGKTRIRHHRRRRRP